MKKVTKTNEQTFYDTLKAFFVGPAIEGQGGFVKLFKARQTYFQKLVTVLQQEIEKYNNLKEDICGLLNEFLIFSAKQHSSWDMQKWFYYVKTDVVFQSMSIEANGFTFFFDASQVSYKKNNEKRSIVYELKEVKNNTIVLLVHYEESNTATNIETILKTLGNKITETELKKVFRKYERKIKQTERDFFIHKDVKNFLREKLKLWLGQYVYNNELTEDTTIKLQTAKGIIHKLIDLIGTFEDEILRLWNTPKSEMNVNYVITLDRIAEHRNRGLQIIDMILNHKNVKEQIKEWQALGIIDNGFFVKDIKTNFEKYKHLPIDTKYFKDIEHNIIDLFDNLDNALDGWLIKSENWQALNTILNKYREKIKTIYIDPPYNTGSDDFLYRDSYQHSSWLTMMENRLSLAKELMSDDGVIFVSIGNNANVYKESYKLGLLMESLFEKRFSDLIWKRRSASGSYVIKDITEIHEYILCYGRNNSHILKNILSQKRLREYTNKDDKGIFKWHDLVINQYTKEQRPNLFYGVVYNFVKGELDFKKNEKQINNKEEIIIYPSSDGRSVFAMTKESMKEVYKRGVIGVIKEGNSYKIKIKKYLYDQNGIIIGDPLKSILDDNEIPWNIGGTAQATKELKNLLGISFDTTKPSDLIKLLLYVSTLKSDIILDFFAGSGTTAHAVMKLNKEDGGKRKFILVEMGNYFDTVIIPRVKKVAYSFNWRDGKPQDADGIGVFFKYYELEQFDDVLNKLDSIISNYLIADIKP